MNNETNVVEMVNNDVVKDTVETGMEVVTEVVKNNGLMKKFGVGAGLMLAGAAVYKGAEMLTNRVVKPAFNKLKDKRKKNQSEVSDEKSTKDESIED